jgi:predicted SAM-dependent methyltransferase
MEEYNGKDNLDIMSFAINYNNSIFNWLNSDINSTDKILDFGAGKGEFCNRFDSNIYAVELDTSMHKYLKCKAVKNIKDYSIKFNMVYSSNVLEHIEDDKKTIKDIYASLNVGGVVKILVPSRMELYSHMDKKVGHFRRYNKKELISKFNQVGFEVKYCRYFDFIGYFATLIYKIMGLNGDISKKSLIFYDTYIYPISQFIDFFTFGSIIGKNIILKVIKK